MIKFLSRPSEAWTAGPVRRSRSAGKNLPAPWDDSNASLTCPKRQHG